MTNKIPFIIFGPFYNFYHVSILGSCSITRAAEIGLTRALDLGFRKVILELDSLAAVISIEGPPVVDSRHGPIVHHIQQLRCRKWQVVVLHCYREANRAADLFAHFGHSRELGTHFPAFISSEYSECFA
ncbi:hypothetical protein LINPERPRIM_LOCUS24364 [Linum perenne]